MHTLSEIPQKIFKFFTQKTEEVARTSQFKQRESKLTPTAFIRGLLNSCFSQQFSLNIFCQSLKAEGVILTKQALFDRFNEHTVNFLKQLTLTSLSYFKTEKLSQFDSLDQFTAVNLIDSSVVSLRSVLSEFFQGCGGAASSAAVKVQMMFDYLNGQIRGLEMTSGRENDQGFDDFLDTIQEGALYLMDLGYFKLKSFKKIVEGKGYFVSRLLPGTALLTQEGEPIELLKKLENSPAFFALQLFMGAKAKIPVRLVAQRLPEPIANERRRKLKENHRRRGITTSNEQLALQGWSIYVTNTSREQISNEDIHNIYARRWQIELFFKLSKSLMKLDILNTGKPYRVLIELYGKFLCINLLLLLSAPVRCQNREELSLYKACNLLIHKAFELIRALRSLYRLKQFFTSFKEDLALFAIKDIKKKPPSVLTVSSIF